MWVGCAFDTPPTSESSCVISSCRASPPLLTIQVGQDRALRRMIVQPLAQRFDSRRIRLADGLAQDVLAHAPAAFLAELSLPGVREHGRQLVAQLPVFQQFP